MGLDMYLIKRKKGSRKKLWECEEVMYWRKANAIHKWFVDNCQKGEDNCEPHLVRKNKIRDLCEVCEKIINNTELVQAKIGNGYELKNEKFEPCIEDGYTLKDNKIAKKLLPTQDGFFFGSTSYDQWYFEDVKRTYNKMKEILESGDLEEYNFYYESSW